ncbi:3-hydroxyacyl-CoA dehydrogenase NAD-binding domain-containing protein [Nocardia otitidiscaviarum]|uniref:3-hydroxyacyl-CoA dehydrogenase NAD-binding domain-containing protein n=1 Tax=Nocardia otitidiscaviarum TaxID=1823 RepID=UPI001895ED29|nr:3-hydroxyacyl-CoA dehydrogenase NAD-binding domain-containing protein [Nocardia otitidiscaviarum]MBF6180810.1 enoyl-CoA hydratase/isomerase family protein [Nocardia otitidiscaviarum]
MTTTPDLTAAWVPISDGSPVAIRGCDDVVILRIVNPPVNVGNAAVRRGLIDGLDRAATVPGLRAVVIIGAPGGNFLSGSDLKEFAGAVAEPLLPQVIERIETFPVPVLAALSGTTLGGGLELALGCDARIALADTVIGFPEIGFGMIPGAGGTQRTLRLTTPARTLELVTSGERLDARTAHADGLLDEVVEGDLLERAVEKARALRDKRILRDLPPRPDQAGAVEKVAVEALRRHHGRPQYVAALGAVLIGLALPANRALVHERQEFDRLRAGAEASARRHLFFARRAVTKANRPARPVPIATVGVVGAGTMGVGIARAFAEAGIAVILVDRDHAVAQQAVERLRTAWDGDVDKGRIPRRTAAQRSQLVSAATSMDAMTEAQLVIEAVYEDLDIKTGVLRELEKITDRETVIATNTSYLDVDQLGRSMEHPGRLVGLHFFAPAHRTAVLEIVRGAASSSESMDTAFAAARALGKVPIVAGVCEGFIGNRIYSAYRRQCELMLEEGALPQQIDAAMVQFGFAMGPFAVADMSGLDIAWRMRQRTAATRDPAARYPDVADTLCAAGRFGQKTGAGWYRYEPGSRTPIPDRAVQEIIEDSARRKGIRRRTFTDTEIVERALLTMANEAAQLLEDGIADRPGDIDLMLTLGYGFPEWEGGITRWCATHRDTDLDARLRRLAEITGPGFRIGDLSLLTVERP